MSNTRPPAEPTTRSVWTQKDQAALEELVQRRETIMKESKSRLANVLLVDCALFSGFVDEQVLDSIIRGAEALRDALLPFDGRNQR